MILFIIVSISINVEAQETEQYNMWESIMITPDYSKLKALGDNMRKHNKTYHSEGPYHANVFNISTGPNAGKIIWQMGSMMYSHNDSRPSKGGHDDDWRDNVMPYIKKMHTVEYWRQDDKLSNVGPLGEKDAYYPVFRVRYFEVEEGYGSSVNSHFKAVSDVIKAMEGDNPWGVYYNEFRQGDLGRHIAAVAFMKNWSELDDEPMFRKTFDKVHGEDKWDGFVDNAQRTFSNSWDEIWTHNAHMSGD